MGYATNMVTQSRVACDKIKKLYQDAGSPSDIRVSIASPLPAYFSPQQSRLAYA